MRLKKLADEFQSSSDQGDHRCQELDAFFAHGTFAYEKARARRAGNEKATAGVASTVSIRAKRACPTEFHTFFEPFASEQRSAQYVKWVQTQRADELNSFALLAERAYSQLLTSPRKSVMGRIAPRQHELGDYTRFPAACPRRAPCVPSC